MTLAQAYKKQFGKVSFPFKIYDANGNKTYFEDSDGFWIKREYNSKGNQTYCEYSDGYWWKREYDSKGNQTYFEDSNGAIRGSKKKSSCDGRVIEIDGKKYKLKEL